MLLGLHPTSERTLKYKDLGSLTVEGLGSGTGHEPWVPTDRGSCYGSGVMGYSGSRGGCSKVEF